MREIKFRAWDEQAKVMHEDFRFIKSGDDGNDWLIFTSHLQTLQEKHHPFDNPYFQQQFKVMQFTGLKDVNGVEIYEGDYVSIFDRDDNEFMMCGVVKFGFRGYPGFDIYTRGDNTYSDEYNTFTNDDDLYFKVVGNKYQNPELLK